MKLTDREKVILQLAHRMKPLRLSDVREGIKRLRGTCCSVKSPHDH